jgi:hypothetical protein
MSRFPIAIAACLVPSLIAGCALPTAERSAARAVPTATRSEPPKTALKEQTRITLERIQQVRKSYPLYRTAASTPGFECQLDKDDVCHIRVDVFQATDESTGLKYCIGVAPEYVIIKGKPKAKDIQWELQLVSEDTGAPLPWGDVTPQNSTLGFLGDKEHGILIIKNIYEGGNPNKPQLKDGTRVKWNGVDNTGYRIKNDHKENGTATYLPIIVHTVGGVPGLCGSPDPAIYNVD